MSAEEGPGVLGGELRGGDIDEGIERILHPRPCRRIAVCANPWCGSHFEERRSDDRLCSECARWASINSRIPPIDVGAKKPVKASEWLDQHRAVEQMTWAPGLPEVMENRLVAGGGWIERTGCRTFNLYQPPVAPQGDAPEGGPWLVHVERVFPAEALHIVRWLAHRVQRPGEKINPVLALRAALGGRT